MFHKTKVVVAGATGYIGGQVLKGLCQKGFAVRALARDPERLDPASGCKDIFVGQATQPETLYGLCDGFDVVFSSIGVHNLTRSPTIWEVDYQANINILNNAREAGVRHVVFVSVLHGPAMAHTSQVARAREAVAQALIQSGIQYTIFRPTAFFNDMEHLFATARHRSSNHSTPICMPC